MEHSIHFIMGTPCQVDSAPSPTSGLPQGWKKHSTLPSLLVVAFKTSIPPLFVQIPAFSCASSFNPCLNDQVMISFRERSQRYLQH